MNMDVLPADLMQWLTGTMAGEFTLTVLVSMIPVVELRGGIPSAWPPGCRCGRRFWPPSSAT